MGWYKKDVIQCVSNGVKSFLHWPIDMIHILYIYIKVHWLFEFYFDSLSLNDFKCIPWDRHQHCSRKCLMMTAEVCMFAWLQGCSHWPVETTSNNMGESHKCSVLSRLWRSGDKWIVPLKNMGTLVTFLGSLMLIAIRKSQICGDMGPYSQNDWGHSSMC